MLFYKFVKRLSMRILLLEDDLVLSSEISTFLASNDILCETSSDGEEFLTKTTGAAYDIYLLDINVPKINGLEVTQIVRKPIPILRLLLSLLMMIFLIKRMRFT